MNNNYKIIGLTCGSCKAKVEESLLKLPEIETVDANVATGEISISMKKHLNIEALNAAIPEKYKITAQEQNIFEQTSNSKNDKEKSKLAQLKPLFLILFYITVASILLHYKDWIWQAFMLDFMGLFYIVFSFFKMLDLKGFPESFSMYDPLAKKIPLYGKIYPFIETALGVFFLMRFQIKIALILTIIILGLTTIGVTKTLLNKKRIHCACLGTTLKLPMTEATFIENVIMLVMAVLMLIM